MSTPEMPLTDLAIIADVKEFITISNRDNHSQICSLLLLSAYSPLNGLCPRLLSMYAVVKRLPAARYGLSSVTQYQRRAMSTIDRNFFVNANKTLEQGLHEDMKMILQSMAGSREVDYWLSHYGKNGDNPEIGVIKVGGAILANEKQLTKLVTSVSFLKRAGLAPVIIHGAGPQLIQALADQKIVSNYVEGLRVTTPETLKTARRVFLDANRKLVKALNDVGTKATPIDSSVFEAKILDQKNLGYVGEIVDVHVNWIHEAVRAGEVPVVPPMGESVIGQSLNINADIAAVELAKAIQPRKVIYINDMGGLLDGDDKLIRNINYPSDYEWLLKQPWLRHGTKLKVREIGGLLDHLPPTSSVSVTSPDSLMKELFTHGGQGTLCRKETPVIKLTSFDDPRLNLRKFKEMLYAAFFKEPTEEWLEHLRANTRKIYLCENYSGMILLTNEEDCGVPYMDKFVVTKFAQGIGTGKKLWVECVSENPTLFWRSRQNNPINKWYYQVSHGAFRDQTKKGWVSFFRGLNPLDLKQGEMIQNCIKVCSTKTSSWAPRKPGGNTGATLASLSATPGPSRLKVGLLGARGYVGMELLRLIGDHPRYDLVAASSRSLFGRNVGEVTVQQATKQGMILSKEGTQMLKSVTFSNISPAECARIDVDLWFLALPNGLAAKYVRAINDTGTPARIIDLSADYRFSSDWVYGLSEKNRHLIKGATRISNPGCYATAAQFAVLPLLPYLEKDCPPRIFGISGYSGAGTTPGPKNDPDTLRNNLIPYSLSGHIHEREVSRHLKRDVYFMPHVASFFRGIHLTVHMALDGPSTAEDLRMLYRTYYADEPLVHVLSDPHVAENVGRHHAAVGNFTVGQAGRSAVVTATIDNLLKGAATQAVQNANLSFGLEEYEGLRL